MESAWEWIQNANREFDKLEDEDAKDSEYKKLLDLTNSFIETIRNAPIPNFYHDERGRAKLTEPKAWQRPGAGLGAGAILLFALALAAFVVSIYMFSSGNSSVGGALIPTFFALVLGGMWFLQTARKKWKSGYGRL